jgi:hypothetical protein
VPENEWNAHPDVVKLSTRRMTPRMGPGAHTFVGSSQYGFGFGTLDPGKYRLKAVWDHRPPHASPRMENILAEPGDYESAFSAWLEVAAAERRKGVVLECTNRVGDAPVFFRDDERWAAEHPADYDPEAMAGSLTNPQFAQKRLKSISLKGAVLKTYSQERALRLVRLTLVEQLDWNTSEKTRYTLLKFFDPQRRKQNENININVSGKVVDEHGCVFEGSASSSSGRFCEVYINPFPFGSSAYRFEVSETEHRFDSAGSSEPAVRKLASFTVTNTLELRAETLVPEELPVRRQLGAISVELAPIAKAPEVQPFYRQTPPSLPELTFWQGGEQTSAWRLESVSWRDRWGSRSPLPQAFCKEERVLKLVARVARDFELAEFTEEETWTVPIEKVPGPGESVPLRLSREWMGARVELLSIGGPGEYSYENGRLKEASKQIATPSRTGPPRGGPYFPGRTVNQQEPKIYFVNSGGVPPWINPGRPVQVVARTPHLVYRAAGLHESARVHVLEQRELAQQERNHFTPPHMREKKGEIQYGALSFRPGQQGAVLTVVAQQAKSVEFAVKRPSAETPAE